MQSHHVIAQFLLCFMFVFAVSHKIANFTEFNDDQAAWNNETNFNWEDGQQNASIASNSTDSTGLEKFEWAPFVDVRAEVDRQLNGQGRQSFVINNWDDFKWAIEPNCSETAAQVEEQILVIVKTAPNRTAQRDAIRDSFGAMSTVYGYRIRTVFVMGALLDWHTELQKLEEEAWQWGDLLVGEHQDDYFHSCNKFANSIKLARNFCGSDKGAPFVLLLDDDYVMFPWELIKEIEHHAAEDQLYEGFCYFNVAPIRDQRNKWAVTQREYPFQKYPPYCTGGTVLLSRRTVKEFYLAIPHVEFFVWEDVYTGILAYLLGITPTNNPNFWGIPHKEEPKPADLDCEKVHKLYPDCRSWNGVITAHGYSPEEIGRIYEQNWQKWQQGGTADSMAIF